MATNVTAQRFQHVLEVGLIGTEISELGDAPTSTLGLSGIVYEGTLDQQVWGRKIFVNGNELFAVNQLPNADATEQDFVGSKLRYLIIGWSDDATGDADLKFDGPWGNGFADVEVQPGQTSTWAFPGLNALTIVSMHEIKFEPIGGAQGDLTVIMGVSL